MEIPKPADKKLLCGNDKQEKQEQKQKQKQKQKQIPCGNDKPEKQGQKQKQILRYAKDDRKKNKSGSFAMLRMTKFAIRSD